MDRFEDLPEQRGERERTAGARDRTSGTRGGRWRTAAWLTLVVGTAGLVGGVVAGEGLLIAAGLVLAGVAGHLFTPEFRHPGSRHPGNRRPG